jgi:glycosyltransferase involved in cell wall biosynthesis
MLMLAHHDPRRYEPGVLFFSDGPLIEAARSMGARVHVLDRPVRLRNPLSLRAAIAKCAAVVRRDGYSLLHSCMSYPHLVAGVAAATTRVPAVLYQHGPIGTWIDGAATVVRCDHILTNSSFSAAVQRTKSWRTRPITVAPCAVGLRISDEERGRLRGEVNAEHGLSPEAKLVGLVARFDPLKGIDVAIRAMAPLFRQRPLLRFVIIGGQFGQFHPGYSEMLRSLIASEGVSDRVIFAGYRMDVRPYYARLDALVNCSLEPEGFGLTLVEAMAAGVPVVAPRCGGPAEIIDDGVDGLMHSPGDVAGLREALVRILDNESFRMGLITAGIEKVENRYRPAAMMSIIEGVYDRVLEGSK